MSSLFTIDNSQNYLVDYTDYYDYNSDEEIVRYDYY